MYVFLFQFIDIYFFVSLLIGFQFMFTLRGRYLNIFCIHIFSLKRVPPILFGLHPPCPGSGFFSDRVLETPVYLYIYWAASPPNKTSYEEGFIFNSLLTFTCQ